MDCQDILVDRSLDFVKIRFKIAQMFSIEPSEVLVAKEIPEFAISESIQILCQMQELEGDFKQMMSIYFRDSSLSNFLNHESLGVFCEFFQCVCLNSDDDVNPYSMILIKGVEDYQEVYLSHEFLDEEKYVLAD